jgi:hypothetical protein
MSKRKKISMIQFAVVAALLSGTTRSFAGDTIPTATYSVSGLGKGSGVHTGLMVGQDPFWIATLQGQPSVTIDVVVIPLVIQILAPDESVAAVFDPTAPDSCDSGVSAVTRVLQSPLAVKSDLSFNGVSVGNTQYINGFKRAQFWNYLPFLSVARGVEDTLNWSVAEPIYQTLYSNQAIVVPEICGDGGIVSKTVLASLLSGAFVPNLQASKVISPTKLAVFLVKNIKASDAAPPSRSDCCVEGAHSATGSPSQTYLWANYDTSDPTSDRHDIRMLTHELAEWLMDPRGDNSTPAWSDPQSSGACASTLEVGDPMHDAALPPALVMNGYSYHVQELAFFSWFFNGPSVPSYGAGGSFSSNGTFSGPAPACP